LPPKDKPPFSFWQHSVLGTQIQLEISTHFFEIVIEIVLKEYLSFANLFLLLLDKHGKSYSEFYSLVLNRGRLGKSIYIASELFEICPQASLERFFESWVQVGVVCLAPLDHLSFVL